MSPATPAFSLLCCPHPPDRARRALFPSGEGGDQGYFMQGASPLASPRLNPGGTGFSFGKQCPKGGLSPGLPAGSAVPAPKGGFVFRLACLPCHLFAVFPPSPRPPSRREGGDQGYFMQGASPLAFPALNRLRHWLNLRSRHPARACPPAFPVDPVMQVSGG